MGLFACGIVEKAQPKATSLGLKLCKNERNICFRDHTTLPFRIANIQPEYAEVLADVYNETLSLEITTIGNGKNNMYVPMC